MWPGAAAPGTQPLAGGRARGFRTPRTVSTGPAAGAAWPLRTSQSLQGLRSMGRLDFIRRLLRHRPPAPEAAPTHPAPRRLPGHGRARGANGVLRVVDHPLPSLPEDRGHCPGSGYSTLLPPAPSAEAQPQAESLGGHCVLKEPPLQGDPGAPGPHTPVPLLSSDGPPLSGALALRGAVGTLHGTRGSAPLGP